MLNRQPASSLPSILRLDRALFGLRWIFAFSALALALAADGTLLDTSDVDQNHLLVCAGVALGANLLLGALLMVSRYARLIGIMTLILDSAVAGVFLWAYDAALPPFMVYGVLTVLVAGVRYGTMGVVAGPAALVVTSGVAMLRLEDMTSEHWATWGVGMVLLTALGALSVVVRGAGIPSTGGGDQRELEALRLRAARERARALSEMANTLGASLDHQRVLEAAQMIGSLALHEDLGGKVHLVSGVYLFQGKDNKLRMIASRGLTRADEGVALAGREGVLGLALKQAEPVFAGAAVRDPELQYIAGFQAAKAVLVIPLRSGFDNYGLMVFGCDRLNAFSNDHRELMEAIGKQATLALQNSVLYQNLLTEKEKIVEVEEDARKKLARDLHDGPTQSVAAIAMRANFIRRLIERQPQQAIQELWKVEDLARRTTKEIRHMLFTLRPLVLETQGLVAALNQLAEKMQDTHNTAVAVVAQDEVEKYLDLNAQGVLFYIVEEAVNNARKHAESSQIFVRLYRREQTYVIVEIEDNGVGFDLNAINSNYDQRGSLGMVNMRERAELIEGTLRIQSAPGIGTKISVLIPIHPSGMVSDTLLVSDNTPPLVLQSQRPDTGSVADRLRAFPGVLPTAASDTRPSRPSRPITPTKAGQPTTAPQVRPITGPTEPPSAQRPVTPRPQPPVSRPVTRPQPPVSRPVNRPLTRPVNGSLRSPDEHPAPPLTNEKRES